MRITPNLHPVRSSAPLLVLVAQLGRIKDHGERGRTNTEEDARGSKDNQTEGDGEESVEHLQPDGTVAGDDILVPK